ncbi:MAG: CotH kinase family protein [Clostridia bacterium]|nr:CotH kinase family protein [Clostridia bacterium]
MNNHKKLSVMLYYIGLLFLLSLFVSCNNDNKNTSIAPTATIPSISPAIVENATATKTAMPSESATTGEPTPTANIKPTAVPTEAVIPTATPKKELYNGNTNFTETKSIIFSHPSGFYDEEFILKLTYDNQYTVRYTTNGNNPTASSSIYHSTGIGIEDSSSNIANTDKVTVIRAAAFSGSTKVSETVTATYIVSNNYNSFEACYNDLAVVSISTDIKNLYGDTGIFTNYTEHGRESERPAHVEFFDSNGTAGFSVDAGLKVYGGTSRGLPQKSLKLVARKEYDPENGKFKYAMLPDSLNSEGVPVDRFDSFVLRAGGNDNMFSASRNTFLRDALVHILGGKMGNIAFQAYRPVSVYINGEYWGMFNLRDDTDNDYLEQHYNIPKDDIAIIAYSYENGSYIYKVDEGTDEDLKNYKDMLLYIGNTNMANSANYAKACQMLDMDNFMKYIAINVFANNRDWPHNNVRAWKYKGQWHFILKDIDYSWGLYERPGQAENVIAEETAHSENILRGGAGTISKAFASLMRNSTFKNGFLAITDDIVNKYFSTATASSVIDQMIEIMSHEFFRYAEKTWYTDPSNPSLGSYKIAPTFEEWINATKTLYEYAEKRPAIFKALVQKIYP